MIKKRQPMIPKIKHLIIAGQKIELDVSQKTNQNIHSNGVCWSSKGYIWIDKDAPEFAKKQILLHEVMHMIQGLFQLEDMVEAEVSTYGNVLLQFIQDNPRIIDWLKGGK
jgi:hypothetical protein